MASHYSNKILCCASVLLLAACKPSAPPSVAPATTETASPQPTQTQTPEQLEAESSLSVKRGIVTQKDKAFSIRLCSANNEVPLTDQPDGTLARTYAELGSKPIYIEAYGERATAPDIFSLEELLYASAVNPTNACTAPAAAYELMARGSEPAWSVEVNKDSMLLRQNDAPTEIKFTGVDTTESEGSVTYRAGVDKHILELTVTQRTCHDKTTGEYFAYNAVAKLDKRALNGCARVGE
jgi:uncharacterized membrane protein